MDTMQLKPFIRALAEKSGAVIRPYFANPDLEVESKADASPVTAADRQAEVVMRDLIRKTYPSHGIVGEEYGTENENAEYVWMLDPIDGTISFAAGCPLFGTLICLLHRGKPVLGAINQPVLDQLCLGDGEQTTMNGRPVKMRETRRLSDAMLLATDIVHIEQYQDKGGFEELLKQVKTFRGWGDCYGYVLLVAGGADIMLDPIMNPWDLLPLIPIIEGAGGVITTWSGEDAATGNSCVAANQTLHSQVIQLLNYRTVE